MAKTLYSASMSLDGFIAGPNGDMSWLADYVGPDQLEADPLIDELIESIGALLIGVRRPHHATTLRGGLVYTTATRRPASHLPNRTPHPLSDSA